jgi:hypothetical protein
MTEEQLKTTPTYQLINILNLAAQASQQDLVNIVAYELASRIWVPNEEITLEQMATDFGYVKPEEDQKVLRKKR